MTINTSKANWVRPLLWLALTASGCAHGVKPDDMSATAHRGEARRDYATADWEHKQYDPNARQHVIVTARGADGSSDASFNPTQGHLDQAERKAHHARQHLAAAAELERFEDQQCTPFAPTVRAACPVLGPVASVEDIHDGVRLRLQPEMPIDAVLTHMRCHLAYARAHGWQSVPDCPLYLRGVEIRRSADGSAIDLIASDRKTADELRRRAREETRPAI